MFSSFFLVAAALFLGLTDPIRGMKMALIMFVCIIPFLITIILGVYCCDLDQTNKDIWYSRVKFTFLYSWVIVICFFLYVVIFNFPWFREWSTPLKLIVGLVGLYLITRGIHERKNWKEWRWKYILGIVIISGVIIWSAIEYIPILIRFFGGKQ